MRENHPAAGTLASDCARSRRAGAARLGAVLQVLPALAAQPPEHGVRLGGRRARGLDASRESIRRDARPHWWSGALLRRRSPLARWRLAPRIVESRYFDNAYTAAPARETGLTRPLGQPPVIGQLAAGILLGPSLLGFVWPSAEHALFSAVPFVGGGEAHTRRTASPAPCGEGSRTR